ncbi:MULTISPECIES: hypothetical protein [Rhizobium]|uniref:hypothetical protein n=1 Tax=Rhizobium TaxID=379 RepID=UPI00103AD81D|nr:MULTISPECIES: hypothetical protein [Rhizobium]MDH6659961.1 hypothetical protein [Rhizobium sophorae]MBB4522270.1 hypothetical protein [Rhizobium leguminosarum]NKK95247.1 hypothetical protein [Rhizobium leguminosarum bv. viciae]TCA74782.1 hypothetical protein E0H74_34435 [Rhizobium leguminosarum bv. viciae]TCA87080.1 hypothetical protein E0H76_34895 [Rhizobium leguminosarum bv. viciae]
MSFDGEKFGREVVGLVRDYMERNLSPVIARLDALESRLVLLEAQAGTTKAKPTVRVAARSEPAT